MNDENQSLRDFPGRDRLIEAVDQAVSQGECCAIAQQLRRNLCALMREESVRLPDCVFEAVSGHYARREIHRSPEHRYAIIAMTWGPGQGTPLHDHSGLWCVEGVWHGELEITQYELLEVIGERARFRAAGGMIAGPGSAGSLIPPHEYHTIRNTSADAVAVSLHIYQAEMACCSKFGHREGEWYARETTELATDKAA